MNNQTHIIQYPTGQPTVIAVPLANQRVAIHRGTRQSDPSVILDDKGSWKVSAFALMTGEHTSADIIRLLAMQNIIVDITDLLDYIKTLADLNAVGDVSFFSMDGLRSDQTDRYSRNLNGFSALSGGGIRPAELQKRLLNGHVLMLGAGGLGSCTSTALAMAGCGTISILDFDHIELGNLNRQLFTVHDIGKRKVDGMKERIEMINPDVKVNTYFQRLMSVDDVALVLDQIKPDIVVAAIDRPTIAADRWISDACFAAGIPAVFNSVSAGKGLLWTKVPGKTGCFQCDEMWSIELTTDHHNIRRYREDADLIPATSAFSYSAMTVGGMMASDIVRHLVGWPMATAGKLVVIDFATLSTNVIEKPKHDNCPICGHIE